MSRNSVSPADLTVRVLANKWKPTIITLLASGNRRFSKLHVELPGVAHKVLIEQLRQLEQDGVVVREVKVGGYRRVHYSLTDAGRELLPILELMTEWGLRQVRPVPPHGDGLDRASPTSSEPSGA